MQAPWLQALLHTPFRNSNFTIDLPGKWEAVPQVEPDLWMFQSEEHKEHLSVSVFQYSRKQALAGVESGFRDYLATRLKAERSFASTGSEFTPLRIEPQGRGFVGTYSDFDKLKDRRFYAFSIGNSTRVVTFYFECLDMSPEEFSNLTRSALGKVQVVD